MAWRQKEDRPQTFKISAGCRTTAGNVRENNQDAVLLRLKEKKGRYFVILAVCDGIGGLEHGEQASSLAVKKINDWYDRVCEWIDIETVDPELLIAHLKDMAEECNDAVCEYRRVHRIETGTTLSLLMIIRNVYYIIQVGDSRVYCYRDKALLQLTRDASVTRVKDGRMKQYLDNFLGKQPSLWFTDVTGAVCRKDIFLVCSDGLYHHLQPEDLEQLEKAARNAKKTVSACEELIQRMLERGERDNISVGLIAVE